MKDKSHKFGYELLELYVYIGFAHMTEIYCGQENDHKFWKTKEPNMGASGGVVLCTSTHTARPENNIVF
jgi:hypothetical protein